MREFHQSIEEKCVDQFKSIRFIDRNTYILASLLLHTLQKDHAVF